MTAEYRTPNVDEMDEKGGPIGAVNYTEPGPYYAVRPLILSADGRPMLSVWFHADGVHSSSYVYADRAAAERFAARAAARYGVQAAVVGPVNDHLFATTATRIVYRTDVERHA